MLADQIRSRIAGTYWEPFLGSGAMFFAVAPKIARLSDTNQELINAFKVVKAQPQDLQRNIKKLEVNAETYYSVRSSKPRTDLTRAARFVYLNRTCFGGIYRENSKGEFNVPFGGGSRTPETLWRRELLDKASERLHRSKTLLRVCDFERQIDSAKEGDVVYCDPVYGAFAGSERFDRYSARVFNWDDHVRLALACNRAKKRGVLILVSNTTQAEVRDLFSSSIQFELVRKKRFGRTIGNDLEPHRESLLVFDPKYGVDVWTGVLGREPMAVSNGSALNKGTRSR